jgi:hypothetical protein
MQINRLPQSIGSGHLRRFLEKSLKICGFQVRADGSMDHATIPVPDEAAHVSAPDVAFDPAHFIAEIMATPYGERAQLTPSKINRTLTIIIECHRRRRRAEIVARIDGPCDPLKSAAQWIAVATLFDMPAELSIAILMQFMWLVQCRCRGLPVAHHLMPIIVSHEQGTGKTTFVNRLLRELEELVKVMSILDVSDRRVGDLDRFAVGFIDDMEKVPAKNIETLKGIITAEKLSRRKLQTSRMVTMEQRTTLIGTSNRDVQFLVNDPTGNRRFVQLPFRNGNVERGGSADVWEIVDSIDFLLLWQSVDWKAPAPILTVLPALVAHQASYILKDDLAKWYDQVNANPELIKDIYEDDGVAARKLYERFRELTKSNWTEKRFGMEMTARTVRGDCPFLQKSRKKDAIYYPLKKFAEKKTA